MKMFPGFDQSRWFSKKKQVLQFTAFIGLITGLFIFAITKSTAQDRGLFTPLLQPPEVPTVYEEVPQVLRFRYVRPYFDALNRAIPGSGEHELELNLFEDVFYTGIVKKVEVNRSGSITLVGTLKGAPFSSFTLLSMDPVLMGTIKLPGAFYRVAYLQDDVHIVVELEEGSFPPEQEPIPIEKDPGVDVQASPAADDGSLIDVLVVYTAAARESVGGSSAAIETLIDTAVAETNTSYISSGISQQIRLIHSEEVDYSEAGFNWETTISRLQNPTDDYMDGVHTLRNDTCADAVVLLVGDSSSCGIAYMMASISPSFEGYAFSVVSTNCATGYYSFGHELGHNMGARHDWYVDDADTYAHGFVNAPDRWRTIMAYNADCADRGFDCSRLQYWSNPFVLYNSDPMGVENGTSRSCITAVHDPDCDADNHLMLNSSALTVANFRDSAVCGISTYNIEGYVRDSTSEGIEGVNVDFEGVRPAVVTNEAGYYNQSGFADGNYTVHFTSQGHMFLPADPLVTVAGSDAVQDATGYPAAVLPFSDGFESGILGKSWIEAVDNEGRVRIESLYPYLGNYSLLLDNSIDEGSYSHASGSLFVDLSDHKDVRLSFWWREFDDEDHPDDGVFISDDYGATWSQAFSFNGSTEVFTHTIVDLDSAASAAGMTLNNHFLVKFQFFDNLPIPSDGYAIDDVQINTLVGPLKYQTHTVNDDVLGDSRGDDDGITECGETIELFVTLANQGSITARQITATLSTLDPYATFLFNNASSYPDIPGGGTGDNVNDYDLMISSQAPDGHSIPFVLDITASNGGRWTDSFDLTVGCKVHIPLVIR